jgi:hypothetical protein
MNAKLYKEILGDFLIPFMASKYDFNCILHQDGDPKHTSKMCKDYLDRNQINWVKNL